MAFDKNEIISQEIKSDYSINGVRKNGSDLEQNISTLTPKEISDDSKTYFFNHVVTRKNIHIKSQCTEGISMA